MDSGAGPAGPYDGSAPEADLWFLPDAAPALAPWTSLPPLQPADLRLIHPQDWVAAQGALAGELAGLALLYGALEERLAAGPAGWRHRLALLEAAGLSWAVGDRIAADRLALWEALRLSGVQDDAGGLARAAWAVRRLVAGTVPDPQGLAAFLDRHGPDVADLQEMAVAFAPLYPLTRAAALCHAWRMLGQGGGDATRTIEAAVLAGCVAAGAGRGAAGRGAAGPGFVPQALAGFAAPGGGSAADRLAAWIGGAARATQAALLHLDRLRAWQGRAEAALAGLQGRTPGLLADLFTARPLVTAALAAEVGGVARATVQRNLSLMQARGLLREVTGQGRYRVWMAKL